MWQHDRHPGSCKRRLRIATREIKRLSGRWRKRLNGEVNLLTWRGNKRRKKTPKVVLYIFFLVGGVRGRREREEKERRGINPAYENMGREEGGGGGGGGLGAAGEKGRCACKCGSHPGGCCCRAGKQEAPCPGRCPEISTAESGEGVRGRTREGGIRWRGGGRDRRGDEGKPVLSCPGSAGHRDPMELRLSRGSRPPPPAPLSRAGCKRRSRDPRPGAVPPRGASGVTCRRRRPLLTAEAEGSE